VGLGVGCKISAAGGVDESARDVAGTAFDRGGGVTVAVDMVIVSGHRVVGQDSERRNCK
jgi:hypothetical protein